VLFLGNHPVNLLSHSMSLAKAWVAALFWSADAFRITRRNETGIQIVNGDRTQAGEIPYQVGILSLNRPGSRPWCGGMLISDQWVLSAAHCFQGVSAVTVLVGGHKPLESESHAQFINTEKIINHPSYNNDWVGSWDFSLLKLQKPIKRTSYAKPVNLPYGGDVAPGTKCVISGWGHTRHQGRPSDVLLKGTVTTMSNPTCYGRKYGYRSYQITRPMLCAQGVDSLGRVTDGCQGDSGGPLVCNNVLYGATSWGYGCADPYYPGVWARVYEAMDWIRATMD